MRQPIVLTLFLFFAPVSAMASGEQEITFAVGKSGIEVRDVSAGAEERVLAALPLPGPLYDLMFIENRLYVARGESGITVVDVSEHLHPTALFTFGSARGAIKLAIQGTTLVATDPGGAKVAYDLSERDTPRILPATLPAQSLAELGWPTPHETLETQRNTALRLVAAGTTLMVGGVVLAIIGGFCFYARDQAVQAEKQEADKAIAACRLQPGNWFCGPPISFAGLTETIAGILFLGAAIAHTAAGIPVLAVGKYKLSRIARLQPVLGLSHDTPGASHSLLIGARFELRF